MDCSGMDQPMITGGCGDIVVSPGNGHVHQRSHSGLHGLSNLGLDMQLLSQSIVYCSIVLCGLLISVPVGVTSNNFRGYCIMYADVVDDKIMFGATANCTFVTYLHVITSVIYAGLLAVMYTVAVIKNNKGGEFKLIRHHYSNMTFLCLNVFVTFLVLVSACVVSVGFARWCSGLLVNAHAHHGYVLNSCSAAEDLQWENVDGTSFYACYSLATAASWLCLFSWLVQVGLNILVFIQQKHDDFGFSDTPLGSSESSPLHQSHEQIVDTHERY